MSLNYTVEFFQQQKNILINENSENSIREEAILAVRKASSIEYSPPIQQMIDSEILPCLIKAFNEYYELSESTMLDILWILTNMASGTSTQTDYVAKNGGAELFIQNIGHANQKIVEQAVWGIGNLAGDGYVMRNMLLNDYNCVELIISQVENWNEETPKSIKENVTWTMCNLCRGKPNPEFSQVKPLIPHFLDFIKTYDEITEAHQGLVVDSLWALTYLSDSTDDVLLNLLDLGIIPAISHLISTPHKKILIPVLRILGNFATGSDNLVDTMIAQNIFPKYVTLLKSPHKNIRKEAAWCLSNVMAGSPHQVEYLAKLDDIFESIYHVLLNDSAEVQKEAMYVIANLMASTSSEAKNIAYEKDSLKNMGNTIKAIGHQNSQTISLFVEYLNYTVQFISKQQFIEKIQDFKFLFESVMPELNITKEKFSHYSLLLQTDTQLQIFFEGDPECDEVKEEWKKLKNSWGQEDEVENQEDEEDEKNSDQNDEDNDEDIDKELADGLALSLNEMNINPAGGSGAPPPSEPLEEQQQQENPAWAPAPQ